jgi:hypothetical protein
VYYNCGKNGHFIAQSPYERKEEYDDKKRKKDKSHNKGQKFFKKKSYEEAHIEQEWNSDDDSSKSEGDDMVTVAIKVKSSSNKSLFPNHSKKTCLMAKEGEKKVNPKVSSSPKYVSTDDDTLSSDDDEPLTNEFSKYPNVMIKGLMKQVRVRDELLEEQEKFLIEERKSNDELKKLIALEKGKVDKLDQELAQSKATTSSLKSSIGALQGQYDVL